MLTFALCRRKPESLELTPHRSFRTPPDYGSPISPLSAPLDMIRSSGVCSKVTLEIIGDMQRCTSMFLARWNHMGDAPVMSSGQLAGYDAQLQAIYSRILSLPSSEDDLVPDWTYESCRIAALIYCRSIIHGATFADSANIMPTRLSASYHLCMKHLGKQIRCAVGTLTFLESSYGLISSGLRRHGIPPTLYREVKMRRSHVRWRG
jgi:hypothetical protein